MHSPDFLPEKDWRNLIRDIHNGQVLPVVGPELITVQDAQTGALVPLHRHLAPLLSARLALVCGTPCETINAVASAYLLSGGARKDIYDELRELLDATKPVPNEALLALARVRDFDLFVSSTFDHHLAAALTAMRPAFRPEKNLLAYHPNQAVDIAEPLTETTLFHVLGDYNTYPDFAVWEEDYMEFICGLLQHQVSKGVMPNIFRQLQKRYLLLLGAPFSDWIVRFFLRTARNARLSDRSDSSAGECLADRTENMEPPLIFFFDKLIQATHVVPGDPAAFVMELARRWQEKHGDAASDDDFLARIPDQMPKDAVFISYAREDREAALALSQGLHAAGVPIWLDKARLQLGQNFESHLKNAVADCSFFISLISTTTEADEKRERYFHKERDWAAGRHSDGFVLYLPVAIDATLPAKWSPQREPACFSQCHYNHLPNGQPSPDFVRTVRTLVESFRVSGRPRG